MEDHMADRLISCDDHMDLSQAARRSVDGAAAGFTARPRAARRGARRERSQH